MTQRRQSGFTLVELVISLTLLVIVTAFAAVFVAGPVRGYTDQVRRAELVDGAASSLHRFARDVRRALPNSVRVAPVGTGFAIEMLNSVDGGRYRDAPPPGDATKRLEFAAADGEFNVIGRFGATPTPFSSTSHYLSVYNAGVAGADAWEMSNVITPAGTQIDIVADALAGEDHVTLTPPFRFAYPSPRQRVYLVDGPVSWICDPATGTFRRFAGYAPASDHALRDSAAELLAAGARVTLVAADVAACGVDYSPGAAHRSALVSARLQLARAGESVTLLHQVHVENAP